ncbi:hypothetical protein [Methanobacterium sp.]|uniref:hypothetical protein n=1 Tax=Methanobacterium sp. TaxID=2164 RepID=UPI003C762FCA
MNKNIFVALMVLFMVFVGFQFAEPAAAVKVVDHGTKYGWDAQDNALMKTTWKAYQYNNNHLKIYETVYLKYPKTKKYVLFMREKWALTKVTKNSVKVIYDLNGGIGPAKGVFYDKTKLTAAQYYWRIFRHDYMGI